ncbi:MAG: DUF202 domain-containing protein [Candidatus Thorarchaeota archaeon]|jgi:hypothetical protein
MHYKKSMLLGILLLSVGLSLEYIVRVIQELNRPPIGPTLVGTVPGMVMITLGIIVMLYSMYQYRTMQIGEIDESADLWES